MIKDMDTRTGNTICDDEQLRQSIRVIISTPVGSRVMRRDFGCDLFRLIDQPVTPLLIAKIQAAVAEALQKYEPRVRFSRIKVSCFRQPQRLELDIEGFRVKDNSFLKITQLRI